MGTQQFSLKWNSHQANMLTVFGQLLSREALVDVTLACEGLSIKAHKMVLSACSPFFQSLFVENPCTHPIVIMNDMKYANLKAIVDFMYRGEVNVSEDQFAALLKTAETLKVKGLAEVTGVNLQVEKKQNVDGCTIDVSQSTQLGLQTSNITEILPANRKKRDHRQRRHSSSSSLSDNENHLLKSNHSTSLELIKCVKSEHNTNTICHSAVLSSLPQTNNSSVYSMHESLPSLQQHASVSPLWNQENLTDESFSSDRNYDVEPPSLTRQISCAKNTSVNQEQTPVLHPVFSQIVTSGTVGLVERNPKKLDLVSTDIRTLVQHSETSVSSCILPNNSQGARFDSLHEESSVSPVAGPSCDGNKSLTKAVAVLMPSISDSNSLELSDALEISQSKRGICPVCNRSFKVTYLQQHLALHSSRPMRYSCKICHREFTRHQSLLRHCRTVHASIRKLCMSNDKYCTICDKVFTNNQNYKVHMMKHRPEEDVSISNTSSDFLIAR